MQGSTFWPVVKWSATTVHPSRRENSRCYEHLLQATSSDHLLIKDKLTLSVNYSDDISIYHRFYMSTFDFNKR